jgi:hypothetical protein
MTSRVQTPSKTCHGSVTVVSLLSLSRRLSDKRRSTFTEKHPPRSSPRLHICVAISTLAIPLLPLRSLFRLFSGIDGSPTPSLLDAAFLLARLSPHYECLTPLSMSSALLSFMPVVRKDRVRRQEDTGLVGLTHVVITCIVLLSLTS